MYTTPRKVKQESRLRRTHSLTNSIPITGVMDEVNQSREGPGTIDGSFEHFPGDPSSLHLNYAQQDLAPGNPVSSNSAVFSSVPQLLPQRLNGPSDSTVYCSRDRGQQNRQGQVVFQTHSAKFPIVKEVTVTTRQHLNPPTADPISLGKNNFLQDNFLQSKLTDQSGTTTLTHEQKALTLDSCTAKVIQQKLFADPTQTIRRRNSLDLQKFIQVFNEEQILMSSMQGRHLSETGGVQSLQSLDTSSVQNYKMFDSYNGNNGIAYYNDSNSSNSLSLSSSTADSLDTVIYKTPQASGPSRNWREQMYTESSSTPIQMDQSPSHITRKNNGYPEGTNQFQDQNHSTQFTQGQTQSYGVHNNNYGLDYRSQNQQHLQQQQMQNLSSPPSSHAGSHTASSSLRTGNGPPNNTNGNGSINPYSSTQSTDPIFTKQKHPSVSSTSLDKGKDSTKLFHTKTYNHIKDMISSRFGNPGSGPPQTNLKGVLSSTSAGTDKNLNNAASGAGGIVYNNGSDSCGLPLTSYNPHHHNHSTGQGHSSYAIQTNGHGPPYYVVPQNASPESYNSTGNGPSGNGLPVPNCYRSPQMTDRKDVNTSFRKAIQQSTQKSNLTEHSLQLRRSMAESQHFEVNNSQSFDLEHSSSTMHGVGGAEVGHIERAHRALDKLLDPVSNPGQDSSVSASGYSRVQFQPTETTRSYNTQYSAQSQLQNDSALKLTTAVKDNTIPMISHSTKTLHKGRFPSDLKKTSQGMTLTLGSQGRSQHSSVQSSQGAALGLPSVPLVRENGDGSSVVVDGISKCSNPNATETVDGAQQFRNNGLQVLAISPGMENVSSSSECEVKGGQRVGSGQSHTTTDSGLGTVVLTKSPQHSGNTNEPLDGLLGHHVKFNDNMAESNSSVSSS